VATTAGDEVALVHCGPGQTAELVPTTTGELVATTTTGDEVDWTQAGPGQTMVEVRTVEVLEPTGQLVTVGAHEVIVYSTVE
jgi:hypothetical protein